MKCHKYTEMALLTSRNANKHILLALGVNRTARDIVKAKCCTKVCILLYDSTGISIVTDVVYDFLSL